MAKKYDFEFVLTHKSVMDLVKELKDYKQELEKAQEAILKALADYTYERVLFHIDRTVGNTSYIPTGELRDSIIISDVVNNMVRVIADSEYAKYVEFGTGSIGINNPHPKASEYGWEYDINAHGDAGWKYQDRDGNWHWTAGQEAHLFMQSAWEDLNEHYIEITKQVLRERGLIK